MNPRYKFQFQTYQIPLKKPLFTHHGKWDVREGIIITIIDENGNIGQGEIAPLPHFGTETFTEVKDFCDRLPKYITSDDIFHIPDHLSCCQFAFESAYNDLHCPDDVIDESLLDFCLLLPHDLSFLPKKTKVFKYKIGVKPIQEEITSFQGLITQLPDDVKLRLDANGGLNFEEAKLWLTIDGQEKIEYLEQPLKPDQLEQMFILHQEYQTAIALDESLVNIQQIEAIYHQGWRGIYVIKPCICGYPYKLREFMLNHQIDAVFSSVFETAIARKSALKLALELGQNHRYLGFGISEIFDYNYFCPQ
jgi:o-succinylbenzoate synthase